MDINPEMVPKDNNKRNEGLQCCQDEAFTSNNASHCQQPINLNDMTATKKGKFSQ